MKKALVLLAVLLLALTSFGATKTFTLGPAISTSCGASISPTVTVDEASTITDVSFTLAYDPTVLSYTGCTVVALGWPNPASCFAAGGIVTVAAAGPALGGGTMGLVTVGFDVLGTVCDGTASNLDLQTVTFNTGTSGTVGLPDPVPVTVSCPANVPPGTAAGPNPADGATCITPGTGIPLSWTAATGATSYDVYFGTTSPPPFHSNVAALTVNVPGPSAGTVYYWRIDPVNACGTTTGTVWSFTTTPAAPAAPAAPSPADGATGVALTNVILDWADSAGATSYDVWFDGAQVANDIAVSTFTVAGPLTASTPYNWYAVANGDCAQTTTGPTWSFTTTGGCTPVAYAIDEATFTLVSFDLSTPGATTAIGGVSTYAWAADFIGNCYGALFAILDTNQFVYFDTTTAAMTTVGPITPLASESFTGMAESPSSGVVYAVSTNLTRSTLYTIDPGSGAATVVGQTVGANCLIDIAVDSAGVLYAHDICTDSIYTLNPATGAATLLGATGFDANYGQGMEYDEAGATMYLAAFNNTSFQSELRTVNLATGATTLIGAFPNPGTSQFDALGITTCSPGAAPGAFDLVTPLDGAINQPITGLVLDWQDSAGALSYNVYLDTVSPPATLIGTSSTSTYTVVGPLAINTLYYWAVEAVSGCGVTPSTSEFDFTTVAVAPDPDLQFVDSALTADLCVSGGSGNGNNTPDPGETVSFTVDITNAGAGPAAGITGVLSTTTPGVAVTANTSTFPDLLPAATGTSTGAYTIDIAGTVPCGTNIAFQLAVSANAGAYATALNFNLLVGSTTVLVLNESFEGAFPPTGWTVVDHAATGNVWDRNDAFGSTNDTGGSGYCADADSDGACNWSGWDTSLVTPPIDLAGASAASLSFDNNFQDYLGAGDAWVDVTTDGGGTWGNLLYKSVDDAGANNHLLDLGAYLGSTIQIRFRYSDNNDGCAWFWMVDNVRVSGTFAAPTCYVCLPGTPALAYDSHAFTDICTGGGTGSGDGVADPGENLSISVTLGNSGTAAPTGTQATLTTATPGVTVTAGNAAYPNIAIGGTGTSLTPYQVTIGTAVPCGTIIQFTLAITSSEGTWTDTFQIPVGTPSGTINLLTQDFEGAWPPAGWGLYSTGDSADPGWQRGATGATGSHGDPHGGAYFAWHNDDILSADAVAWLVMPAVDLTGYATPSLTFWQRDYYDSYYQYHGVWVNTGTNPDPSGGGFTELWTADTSGTWNQVTIDLSAYAGQTIYLAFRYEGNWMDEWYLDDIAVSVPGGYLCTPCTPVPPCEPVEAPNLVSPPDGSTGLTAPVDLVWDPAANATAYEVWVGSAPGALELLATTSGTTYTLTTLPEGATVYWLISAVNDCSFAHSPLWSFTLAGGGPDLGNMVFVPAASNKTGDRSSQWKTDLEIMNTGDEPADYTITFVPAGTDGTLSPYQIHGTLTAGAMKKFEDIVTTAFQLADASGAVHVRGTRRLIAASRTYNDTGEGTYGQFVMGYGSETLVGPTAARSFLRQGDTGHLVNLISDLDFRSNVGFMEVTGKAAKALVKLYSDAGALLGSRSYELLPMGYHQINNVFLEFGLVAEAPAARAEITVTGEGSVLAYSSVVDNHTNDAVFNAARKVRGSAEEGRQVLAVAARTTGALGTQWRTDLRLYNPATEALPVTCTYRSDEGALSAQVLTLQPGALYHSTDLLQQIFSMTENTHGMLILQGASPFIPASRIYTETETGTYGQNAPVLTADQPLPAGGHGYLLGLRRDAHYRANLGLTLASGTTATVRVDLYDLAGAYEGGITHTLAGDAHIQWNDIYAALGLAGDREGYGLVTVLEGDGTVAAYASVVDNLTNDAIYIPAQ